MKFLLFLQLPLFMLTSCSDYGNKVTISDKSDVFYKGSGVTEADAKRLGDFLLREGIFDTVKNKTIQLTKDSTSWVVKLVVDKEKYANANNALAAEMRILEGLMSEQVFNNQKTKFELADNEMKPLDNYGPAENTDSLSKE